MARPTRTELNGLPGWSSEVDNSLTPDIDNATDIGSPAKRVRRIYATSVVPNGVAAGQVTEMTPEEILTLATNRNSPHAFRWVNGSLFQGGAGGGVAWITRYGAPLTDLSQQTTVTFSNDLVEEMVYSGKTGKLYALVFSTSKILVFEVDPVSLTATQVISDTGFFGEAGSICVLGSSLYVLTGTTPSKIVQYSLTDFSLTASATLTALDEGHALRTNGQWLVATGNNAVPSRGWLARINPATLAFTSQLFDVDQQIPTDDFAILNGKAYVGFEGGGGIGTISTMPIADIATVTRIETGIAAAPFALQEAFGYIFAAYDLSPGKILQLDPADNSFQVHDLPTGHNRPNEIVGVDQWLLVSFFGAPGKVGRYRVS